MANARRHRAEDWDRDPRTRDLELQANFVDEVRQHKGRNILLSVLIVLAVVVLAFVLIRPSGTCEQRNSEIPAESTSSGLHNGCD